MPKITHRKKRLSSFKLIVLGFADSLEIYERFPKDGTFAVRKIFSSEDGKPLDVKMIEDVLEGRADYNKMP